MKKCVENIFMKQAYKTVANNFYSNTPKVSNEQGYDFILLRHLRQNKILSVVKFKFRLKANNNSRISAQNIKSPRFQCELLMGHYLIAFLKCRIPRR